LRYWQVCLDRLDNQAGWDSAWEQEKLEARKIFENAAESPASSARFVGQVLQDGFEFSFYLVNSF
jgi:hypothetical protein